MPFPSKNDILIGIGFILFGVLYALCDRWLVKMTIQGTGKDLAHPFDHFFLMWALKQFLQLQLFIISMAIDKNWLGCARFKHGSIVPRVNPRERMLQVPKYHDNHALVINREDEMLDGNGHHQDEPSPDNDVKAADNDLNTPINGDNAENEELIQQLGGVKLKKARKDKGPSFLIYLPPAVFAQTYMLLTYFGQKLTYSSSFIMLKGSVAFFTALLSMAFLAQQLACYVWFGVVVATLGFAVSGLSDYIHVPALGYEKYGIAAGNLLIVMAQIMFATNVIYQEKFIRKYSIHPMKFLGCEAICGTFIAVCFLLVFNFIDAAQFSDLPSGRLEDIEDAVHQIWSSKMVLLPIIGSLLCYILYTYLGLFLIRDQGALPRIMIETFIWGIFWSVSLTLDWERFFIAQVPGLCIIVIGVLIYSHILVLPFSSRMEGIDHNGSGFTDQFRGLNRQDKNLVFERRAPEEVDDEVLPEGRDGARNQHQDNDDPLDRDVVVELHQQDGSSQENVPNTDNDDENLIQA